MAGLSLLHHNPDQAKEVHLVRSREEPWLSAAVATRAISLVLWAVIATGPLLGGYMWLTDGPEQPAPAARPASAPVRSSLGPADFAVRFVAAWIEADSDDNETLTAFLPNPPSTEGSVARQAVDLRPAGATEVSPGYWMVTVAGAVDERVGNGRWRRSPMRFWQVGVAATGGPAAGGTAKSAGQTAYVVTGPPAEVTGPATARRPQLAYGTPVDGAPGQIGRTVTGFLLSYLTGQPGLDRYLAPGLAVTAPQPSPYIDLRVTQMAVADGIDLMEPVQPTEGRRMRLLVTVVPATSAGPAPTLQYALTIAARAGRWEIAGMDQSPALAR